MPFTTPNPGRSSYLAVEDGPSRMMTPVDGLGTPAPAAAAPLMPEVVDPEEEQRRAHFASLFQSAESKISQIFGPDGHYDLDVIASLPQRAPSPPPAASHSQLPPPATDHAPITEPPRKRAKRAINEDDYDDDDDDDDDNGPPSHPPSGSPQKPTTHASGPGALPSPSKSGSSPVQSVTSPSRHVEKHRDLVVLLAPSSDPSQSSSSIATISTTAPTSSMTSTSTSQQKPSSSEDARKQLEAVRTATEEAARRSFHTLFYTLENDRTAMLEQQQLEESEKQLQAEMDSHQSGATTNNPQTQNMGTLSSTNLGASSLTLKHLIARIDMKRDVVNATDSELRLLMNEVRKNRSKWASEENINQEELYEALEKVLTELKAHTEYSTPFLTRVNKREAPDYYNIIKQPMDLGTMTKKLKGLVFKSKADFVADLNLIWDNCLKYNRDMSHPLRRMANGMRKEAEKLIPLIPDLAVRSRAEVEAEERRKQNGGDDDNGEDSEDEPIMSSRGRAGGTTSTKGASKVRRSGDVEKENTPAEQKPFIQVNGVLAKAREGSEVDSSVRGTPPIAGSQTPVVGPQGDAMDVDGPSLSGLALTHAIGETAQAVYEDEEYKIWKQVTKKGRALITRERFHLFKESGLNPDAPALLRRKADMRRFLRNQKMIDGNASAAVRAIEAGAPKEEPANTEALVDNIDMTEEERVVPAYYQPQSLIPDIPPHLQWIEDGEGQVINQNQWAVKVIDSSVWKSPANSKFAQQIDANIHQIQETRKLSTKISVVKQMQVQTQVYSNQFPKTADQFVEADVPPQFVTDDGPLMAGDVCEKALRRSIGKIFYHAGFEELQPSAIDAITGIAADYFQKLCRTFTVYNEADKVQVTLPDGPTTYKPRYTPEEVVLHTLDENGYDIATLEAYVTDDTFRLSSKLSQIHERMKQHLTDILRPALTAEAGVDGVGAFNDGSEQFVSGDFAEDLGEDFFGFRELGLDKDLGLDMLSVPLHLLQSRMRSQYQQTQTTGTTEMDILPPFPPHTPVTRETLNDEVGLVRNFFLAKLHASNGEPLIEDEDLPIKQRRPRPRLPATGKISAPQKKPLREQIALAKKKKKMEAAAAAAAAANSQDSAATTKASDAGDAAAKAPSRQSVSINMRAGLPAGSPDQGLKSSQMSIAVGGDME
ncbi:hypothetical protein BROUX41_006562 [Berkeleyomyces rouxiae]|uniref:uncharacterized protein n=1 Tax=Berkeleyomyces rouxiae TaxID=2035830 RepID=UPI003B7E8A7D